MHRKVGTNHSITDFTRRLSFHNPKNNNKSPICESNETIHLQEATTQKFTPNARNAKLTVIFTLEKKWKKNQIREESKRKKLIILNPISKNSKKKLVNNETGCKSF